MAAVNEEKITIAPGESTSIKLKGLGTAGYQWNYTIEDNAGFITISKDLVLTGKANRSNAGASADEVFTIKANKKGMVHVYFFQKRSWEKNADPVNEKKVTIIIE